MKTDILLLGPLCKDCNVDYDGTVESSVGGAVTYCSAAAAATGASVYAALKAEPADRGCLEHFPLPASRCTLLTSSATTRLKNIYLTPDRDRRVTSCLAQADPVALGEVPPIEFGVCHLAGLLSGDFSGELIRGLSGRGPLAADAQGFLRHSEDGAVVFRDWAEKRELLPLFAFLKTDAAEAEVLTGTSDLRAAADRLYSWGAKEVLISHHKEMLVRDGKGCCACPVRARNLSGRTGRGDTVFGAYLGLRVQGAAPAEALRYATACVSLKMETPGPFSGTKEDVLRYIEEFYPE